MQTASSFSPDFIKHVDRGIVNYKFYSKICIIFFVSSDHVMSLNTNNEIPYSYAENMQATMRNRYSILYGPMQELGESKYPHNHA